MIEVFRKAQRGSVLEKLFWLQRYIHVFQVSFAVAIGKDSKTSLTAEDVMAGVAGYSYVVRDGYRVAAHFQISG